MHNFYYSFIKPLLDLVLVLLLLIPVHILMLCIVIYYLLNHEPQIFYKQKRAGRYGASFWIYKFKTLEKGELTKPGKLLRTTSLDELPQIWNVIKGDMSFIGPRPLYEEYNTKYNAEQKKRLLVKPGITGLAQVNGRNSISWTKKFEYDIQYVTRLSLYLDLKVLIKTIVSWKPLSTMDINYCDRFDKK